MSQVRFSDKVVDSSCPTENRQQRTDAVDAVPEREAKANPSSESSEEYRNLTGTVCTGNDAIRNRARMTLEKTLEERDTLNQAVVRIVNETAKAWSIECFRHVIQGIIPLASIKQAMETQAEADRSKVKETSRVKSMWNDERQQDCEVLNNSCQFKIQPHMLNRNRSSQDITGAHDVTSKEAFNNESLNWARSTSMSPTVSTKTVRTKEAKDFIKSEVEMVDVMDTLQHAISIMKKEIAKSPTILAEGYRHTEYEQRNGSSHHEEDRKVKSFQ